MRSAMKDFEDTAADGGELDLRGVIRALQARRRVIAVVTLCAFAASLQYRADRRPSSRHERPVSSSAPFRSREIFRRLRAEGSFTVRSVKENCHHAPSMRASRPSFSIAFRIFWLISRVSDGVVAPA